ncbi:hypothetical protein JT31_14385 [Cedecea neteri]|uniref:Uncharacterized protein n=1 Tax=Cedecea neteri TaxID=158822 RepID=A0A089Q0F3_9ENTR|nr:hypothetical protein JT31_14385 [Cedecea neteri]
MAGTFSDDVNRCNLISYVSQQIGKWQCTVLLIWRIYWHIVRSGEPVQFRGQIIEDILRASGQICTLLNQPMWAFTAWATNRAWQGKHLSSLLNGITSGNQRSASLPGLHHQDSPA